MCGRIIQSSVPIRYAIVEGMYVCHGHVHNYTFAVLARCSRFPSSPRPHPYSAIRGYGNFN
jgi:hypothetical protein